MEAHTRVAVDAELRPLLKLTQRVGSDPMLTQGGAGNSSAKLDGVLWIKASGRWMADALRGMPGAPLKLAAPVQPTLRRPPAFDNFRFR